MEGNNLASQEHWDESYKDLIFFKPSFSDPIRRIIKAYAPALGADRSVFEVGCFPGRYLSVFGDLGYVLNGVDLTPRVLTDMPRWLAANNYKAGDFYCDDFFKLDCGRTYDIVCSFGFIEHFVNYDEVLRRHLSLISPGGLLILTTPNFRGAFQKMLHSRLDRDNLERHYLPSMDPAAWKKILIDSGYEILFYGFRGGFDFWAESTSQSVIKKALIKILNLSGKILRFWPVNGASFSPYAVIIAKNKKFMTNYLKKIYKQIFPDWTIYLQRAAKDCDSVLDLACGYNSLVQFLNVKHKVGVEMFEDYLRQSREKGIHDEYFQDNILTIEFPPHSYDLVVASEIIEHLDKADGFILLDNAERWAKKRVVIATPNGYIKQDTYDDNPLQIHKSGWSIEEFKQRGYRVNGIGGFKFIRGERGEYKYKPYALWRLINDIGQKIVYRFPRLAFQLIAVKDIKQDE